MLFTKSIALPNTINLNTGSIDLFNKIKSINQCISLCLLTARGELLGDPDFGSNLYELLFNNMDNDFIETAVPQEICRVISKHEKRVKVTSNDIIVTRDDDNNKCYIKINYVIANSSIKYETTVTIEERS